MGLIVELRRRNVFRMAGLYLVGAWLITQVGSTLLPMFDAPTWAMKAQRRDAGDRLRAGADVRVGVRADAAGFEARRGSASSGIDRTTDSTPHGSHDHRRALARPRLLRFRQVRARATPRRGAGGANQRTRRGDIARGKAKGKPALDRGAAIRQHVDRSGERVFFRRIVRGNPQFTGAHRRHAGGRAHFVVPVQGQERGPSRRRRETRRRHCA